MEEHVKNIDSGGNCIHTQAVWSWRRHLTSLCLCFLHVWKENGNVYLDLLWEISELTFVKRWKECVAHSTRFSPEWLVHRTHCLETVKAQDGIQDASGFSSQHRGLSGLWHFMQCLHSIFKVDILFYFLMSLPSHCKVVLSLLIWLGYCQEWFL